MEDQLYNNLYCANQSRSEWCDPVVFTDQRLTPLLSDTTQYDLAITRFSVNGCAALPLVECPVVEGTGQTDPHLTPYELSLSLDLEVGAAVEWPVSVDANNGVFSVSISSVPSQRKCYIMAGDYNSAAELATAAYNAIRDSYTDVNPVPMVMSAGVDGRINVHITSSVGITGTLWFGDDSIVEEPVRSRCARLFGWTGGVNVHVPTGGEYIAADVVPQTSYTESFTATRAVQWQPERLNIPVPLPPSANGGRQVRSPYYYASSYAHTLRLISETAKLVMNDSSVNGGSTTLASLQGLVNAWSPGVLPQLQTQPPEWSWDNGLIQLNLDAYGWGGDKRTSAGSLLSEGYTMRMNTALWNLVGRGFHAIVDGAPAESYMLVLQPPLGTAPVNGCWQFQQEFSTSSAGWSPVQSVVFTSQLMPVVPENTGPVDDVAADGDAVANAGVVAQFESMISDLEVPIDAASDWTSGSIFYAPPLLRRQALQPRQQLQSMQIAVSWRHRLTGELVPLVLPPGGSSCMKMMLVRRDKTIS